MSEKTKYTSLDGILEEPKVIDQEITIQEVIAPTKSRVIVDWDEILNNVCYKLPKGYPTVVNGVFTEREEIVIINEALEAEGLPTLPLPEAKSSAQQFAEGFINNTHTKEGLIIYFASIKETELEQAKNKLINNTAKQLKLPTKDIKDDIYVNKNDIIHNIKLLNNAKDPFSNDDKKHFYNAITSAEYIRNVFGETEEGIDQNLIDRGTNFNSIRIRAVKLAAAEGIEGMDKDKWCPGDIYIYGSAEAKKMHTKLELLRVSADNKIALNDIFEDTFQKPASDKILAVSLKDEKARGGKATGYIQLLTKNTDYPDVNKLGGDLEIKRIAITQLNAGIKKTDYGELSDALITMDKLKNKSKTDTNLINSITTLLKSIVENPQGGKGKLKNKKDYKKTIKDNDFIDNYNLIKGHITDFSKNIYKTVYKKYILEQTNYINTLKKYKGIYVPEVTKETEEIENNEVINTTIETLLKKTNCYIIGSDLIKNLENNIINKVPPGLQRLAKETNPFIALAAFGMSQAGYSPTFFKLKGSEDINGKAHVDVFPSDGTIKLQSRTAVQVTDKPTVKGIGTSFIVKQSTSGGNNIRTSNIKISKLYQVKLDFIYSGEQFKIEITEIKDK